MSGRFCRHQQKMTAAKGHRTTFFFVLRRRAPSPIMDVGAAGPFFRAKK